MVNVLRVRNLSIVAATGRGSTDATQHGLTRVSFRVPEAKTVALVGDTASILDKISHAIFGLRPGQGTVANGEVLFFDPEREGHFADLVRLPVDGRDYRAIRGARITKVSDDVMIQFPRAQTIGKHICDRLMRQTRYSDRLNTLFEGVTKLDRATATSIVQDMLRLVGCSEPAAAFTSASTDLAIDQQYRAMLAQALVGRPGLVVLFGPPPTLDVHAQDQIWRTIKCLQAQFGFALLVLTQDIALASAVADEIVVLKNGSVVEHGLTSDLMEDARHPYVVALKAATPALHWQNPDQLQPLSTLNIDLTPIASIYDPLKPEVFGNEPIIAFQDVSASCRVLSRTSQSYTAYLKNLSLNVLPGQCHGIIGGSVGGVNAILPLICGMAQPSSGSITLSDRGTLVKPGSTRRVQVVLPDPHSSFNPRLTLEQSLLEPLKANPDMMPTAPRDWINALLKCVGLEDAILAAYPGHLSAQHLQRAALARALVLRPDTLIIHNGLSMLDVSDQVSFLALVRSLQKQLNLTVVFISSCPAHISYVADDVSVFCFGRMVEQGPKQSIFSAPAHPYTQALFAAQKALSGQGLSDHVSDFFPPAHGWPAPFTLQDADSGVWRTHAEGHKVLLTSGSESVVTS